MFSRSAPHFDLPLELHWDISSYLDLPSTLALLKVNRHFSQLYTGQLYKRAAKLLKADPNCKIYHYIIDHDLAGPLARFIACGLPLAIHKGGCLTTKPQPPADVDDIKAMRAWKSQCRLLVDELTPYILLARKCSASGQAGGASCVPESRRAN